MRFLESQLLEVLQCVSVGHNLIPVSVVQEYMVFGEFPNQIFV